MRFVREDRRDASRRQYEANLERAERSQFFEPLAL